MGKIKQYWLLTGLLIVALFGVGYSFGVKPQSAKAAKVKTETATQAAANSRLGGEIQILQKQADGVLAQQKRLRQIDAILPNNKSLPELIRSLSAVTATTGVDLLSMAPGALVPLADAALAEAAAAAAAKKNSAEADTSSKAPSGKNASTAKAPPRAVSAGSLSAMPVTLALTGDFTQLQLFLGKLEKLDRAFVVDSLVVAPAAASATPASGTAKKKAANDLAVSIIGRVFVKTAPVAAAPVKAAAAATTKK